MVENDFHTLDVENLRLHYNRTLLCWENNFQEHIDEVRQILFTNGIYNDLPPVRWY